MSMLKVLRANSFPRLCGGRLGQRAISSLTYELTKNGQVSLLSREFPGYTSTLSVAIAAGSRYQPNYGVAHLLEKYSYKTTEKRSALRIVRESELLGGHLESKVTREHIILTARFLNEYLDYYADMMSEVVGHPKFLPHQLEEEVLPLARMEYRLFENSLLERAMSRLHELAFERSLAYPVFVQPGVTPTIDDVKSFAKSSFVKENMVVVYSGSEPAKAKELCSQYFADLPNGTHQKIVPPQPTHNESRLVAPGTFNYLLFGYPYLGPPSVDIYVLESILGGHSMLKWSEGSSLLAKIAVPVQRSNSTAVAKLFQYSDAGLLTITASSTSLADLKLMGSQIVATMRKLPELLTDDTIKRGIATAKTNFLSKMETPYLDSQLLSWMTGPKNSCNADVVVSAIEKVSRQSLLTLIERIIKTPPSFLSVGASENLPYYSEL
ncbi:ubiquinol-cytochrome-c reductase complex core protein Qcr2 [Schizosaccharomyces japonicus yFS275]|uniref:Cytochrome b-c1 complex subunit 2, mitochondrial n=1 Tax=Schizosaccharomyces japonicus (strain yFS275 / FY16936) TaxID=402676 RepID=B6JWI0_SCHJY|nr:ubiquinol-cytochrome-c reductase complex core protein Qcr2 [Schizosaccharomyces japonicus yFS275]EEB05731.1 ubiquinol-cytochrome-c reductase complex core protein Qcr2 [Schizosaccharomyces japonicus yFS275]